jgi:hypothetical protein
LRTCRFAALGFVLGLAVSQENCHLYTAAGFRCDDSYPCPSGYYCAGAGYCMSGSAPDAGQDGGVVDAGPADAGPADAGGCEPGYPTGTLGGLDCDPMEPTQCGLPFPSNVYLEPNPSTPTCFDVRFGATTLPAVAGGTNIGGSQWTDSDGFSPGATLIAFLPGATLGADGGTFLPDEFHIAASLDAAHTPTILLDTSTNPPSLVPHFAEIDVSDPRPSDSAILLRPMVRLKDATRYIVALRGIVDSTGTPIAPSATFQALRDGAAAPSITVNGTTMTDPSVASRRALYTDIFARLQAAGITTSNLQLAWDFTTSSKQNNTSQLVSMFNQALLDVPHQGPSYTITNVAQNPDVYTAARIRGQVTVPLFLDSAQVLNDEDPLNPNITVGFMMQRDNHGTPIPNGTGQFTFIVNVPARATTSGPLPVVINFHGFFSELSEGLNADDPTNDFLLKIAQEEGFVILTMDEIGWRAPAYAGGMYPSPPAWPADWAANPTSTENDTVKLEGVLGSDIGTFRRIVDRGSQGMLNQLMAGEMMQLAFANDPAVKIGPGGTSVIDTTKVYVRGDSLGGSLGTTFLALSETAVRGWMGEPAVPLTLFLSRTNGAILTVLEGAYPQGNPAMNVQIVTGLMQMYADRLEATGFAPYVTSNTLNQFTPPHKVFIVDVAGDHSETPLCAHWLARSLGATLLTPQISVTPWDDYGLTGMPGPLTGSVLQEFDFGILTDGVDIVPTTDKPATGPNDPHDWVRDTAAATIEFGAFTNGQAIDACGTQDGGLPTSCTFPTAPP